MDLKLGYRLMCQKAKDIQDNWLPEIGDYIISQASYCGCDKNNICSNCLDMSNVFVISGENKFHKSIGGTHWYFGGSACNNNGGHKMNNTFCFVITESGKSDISNEFYTSKKSEMLWLPKQDQIQSMFLNGINNHYKVKLLTEWLEYDAEYNPNTYSLEMLWLMYYMCEKYNKKWNDTSNIKEWKIT